MIFDPINVHAGGGVLIDAPIETVFRFISEPETRSDAISPLEAHTEAQGELSSELLYRCEVIIAGRVVRHQARTSVYEPPTRLVMEMDGDIPGEQVYNLAQEANATRLNLDLRYSVPPDWPSYYREEPTRTGFAETLVSQTLANIQAALEMGQTA
ncbi:MAG: SRPBCC family protein [Chloroflexi bacterium]|nr:SRPBCC family protein [Chloroflexota bacterium]